MVVVAYGAIPLEGRDRNRSKKTVHSGVKVALIAASLALTLALVAIGRSVSNRSVLVLHGSFDPGNLDWDGCGAGGNCGGSYDWEAQSFSPLSGRVTMRFSHDHSSFANWINETENAWVKGAHFNTPFKLTRPAALQNFSVWAPVANLSALEPPMEFFAKIFPKEVGYSCYLFGNCSSQEEVKEEEEEEAPAAETPAEEEPAEAETPPDPLAGYGSKNPMVFGDLAPIHFTFHKAVPAAAAPAAEAATAAATAEEGAEAAEVAPAEGEAAPAEGEAAPAEAEAAPAEAEAEEPVVKNATFVRAPSPLVRYRRGGH